MLPLAARTGSWLTSTKGTAVAIFRSLFETAKQTVKNEERPKEKKKRSVLKSQNKPFAQREREKVNRESLFQGLMGFHFGPCVTNGTD